MAMMHYHTSHEPPLRLFLNDGGLVECLGLIALLRRRCSWMLVTDATADFSMQLVCLRETMKLAEHEHLCTFFDPDEPRRGVEPLLAAFATSKSTYLRIGVLYDAWSRDGPGALAARQTGEVCFVRMRLLDHGRLVEAPRITEQEVLEGKPPVPQMSGRHGGPDVGSMVREEVGGCCCDCCHVRCNCGLVGRFPDISTGNQFLTPTQFALLCRLGYEMSAEAVDSISESQGLFAAEERPSRTNSEILLHTAGLWSGVAPSSPGAGAAGVWSGPPSPMARGSQRTSGNERDPFINVAGDG